MKRLLIAIAVCTVAGSAWATAFNYPIRIPTGGYGYSSVRITALRANGDSVSTTTISTFPHTGTISLNDTCAWVLRYTWINTGDTVRVDMPIPLFAGVHVRDTSNLTDVGKAAWSASTRTLSTTPLSAGDTAALRANIAAAAAASVWGTAIASKAVNVTYVGGSALAAAGTGYFPSDIRYIGGSALSTSSAQLGVNAVNFGGTAVTGRDIGASVLLSSGTGTGQVSLSSGAVTVGTNNDKTAYSLSQSFPSNFASMKISGAGYVSPNWSDIYGTLDAAEISDSAFAAIKFKTDWYSQFLTGDSLSRRIVHERTDTITASNALGLMAYRAKAATDTLLRPDLGSGTGTDSTLAQFLRQADDGSTGGGGLAWPGDSAHIALAAKAGAAAAIDSLTISAGDFGDTLWQKTQSAYATSGTMGFNLDAPVSQGSQVMSEGDLDSLLKAAERTSVASKVWTVAKATYGTDYNQMGGMAISLDTELWASSSDLAQANWEYATRSLTEGLTISDGSITAAKFGAGAITSTVAPNLDVAVSTRLAPTTSGRTLDVTSTGEAGVDFSNISGTLDAAEIGTNAIGAAQIATDAIGSLEIAAGAITSSEAPNLDVAVSSRLAPTTAGRTLDVTSTGEAGIDWANIGSPTSTQSLSGTTVATTTNLSGAVALTTSDKNTLVDLFWDELMSNHSISGSAGGNLDAKVSLAGGEGGWSQAEKDSVMYGQFRIHGDSMNWLSQNIGVNLNDVTGTLDASEIGTDAITAQKIAADAIGASEIAADAIGASEIAAGAITSSEAPNLDAAITTRLASTGVPTNFSQLAIQNGTGYVTSTNGGGTAVIPDSVAHLVTQMKQVIDTLNNETSTLRYSPTGSATIPDSLLAIVTVINENLDLPVSSITGMAGNGAYSYDVLLLDTTGVTDTVLTQRKVTINNLSENAQPYESYTNSQTGVAHFQLDAGTWVVFATLPGYAAVKDTITITGVDTDTLRVYRDAGEMTTVVWSLQKPGGYNWGQPRITLQLVSAHDSMLNVGDSIVTGKNTVIGTYGGLVAVNLYPNSTFTNDSTWYVAEIRDSKKNLLIESYRFAVPVSDTVVAANKLVRWKNGN